MSDVAAERRESETESGAIRRQSLWARRVARYVGLLNPAALGRNILQNMGRLSLFFAVVDQKPGILGHD